jgi:hypothetical protein
MTKTQKAKTFTASTEAEVRKQLADWERAHPKAAIIQEKPMTATGVAMSKTAGTSVVTIYIEFEE